MKWAKMRRMRWGMRTCCPWISQFASASIDPDWLWAFEIRKSFLAIMSNLWRGPRDWLLTCLSPWVISSSIRSMIIKFIICGLGQTSNFTGIISSRFCVWICPKPIVQTWIENIILVKKLKKTILFHFFGFEFIEVKLFSLSYSCHVLMNGSKSDSCDNYTCLWVCVENLSVKPNLFEDFFF